MMFSAVLPCAGLAWIALATIPGDGGSPGLPGEGTLTDSLATIDTGAFALGNKDFRRYTPEMCMAAVNQAATVARRRFEVYITVPLVHDTAPERDTLPQSAIAVGRGCSARFDVNGTAPKHLQALFSLYLQAGREKEARAVIERQLGLAKDAKERQKVLADAAQGYVDAEPSRYTEATWAAAKADTLALAEHANSLPAHMPLLLRAEVAFDRTRMRHEAAHLITLGKTLDFRTIKYEDIPLIEAWSALAKAVMFDSPDSVNAILQGAKEDIGRFPLGFDFPPGVPYQRIQTIDFRHATPVQLRRVLITFDPKNYVGANTLPAVSAPYWFPAKPNIWPPKGQVSLVFYSGWVMKCSHWDENLLNSPDRHECLPLRTFLHEWTEHHAAQGFSLILVARTEGSAIRSAPIPQRAEADSLRWFYLNYLKLKGTTLAVVPLAVVRTAPQEGDGRLWFADTTDFGAYLGDGNDNTIKSMVMLYGRDGRLLYAGEEPEYGVLQAMINRALAAPASAADPATANPASGKPRESNIGAGRNGS